VQSVKVGNTGFSFVVDEKNQVIAHPDATYTAELTDFSQYPPVAMLRSGQRGNVTFTDDKGIAWHAYIEQLDNGWGVITQQQDSEHLAMLTSFRLISVVTLFIGLVLIAIALWFMVQVMVRPVASLTLVAQAITNGDLTLKATEDREDEFGVLARTFNLMTRRLQETMQGLEQRVTDRTRNLELAAEVGRAVSQVRDLDVMLRGACDLILKEFDLYYVQVYLTDPQETTLLLEAGTGSVGAQLLGRGHNLPFDGNSINGRAAVEKRSVVISDTAENATFRQNPLLPQTRGEMAVPLIVSDKVVGVLDMQSREPGVLTTEVLPAFEALAGQLAVAIQNSKLLAEAEEARAEVEKQARRLVRTGWNEHLDAIHKPEKIGFVFNQSEVSLLVDSDESQIPMDGKAVSAPISITGEPLGSLVVEIDDESRRDQTTELVNMVARQVAQQIENLRLLESAERYRYEAEEASRRITRDGWKAYAAQSDEHLSYRYDLKEVHPQNASGDELAETTGYTLPIKVRDEAIGKLVIQGLDSSDTEAVGIANAVAERLAIHIESLRQYDQTQSALMQSEKLFEASSRLTQAIGLQELVSAAVTTLDIPEVNRALLTAFEYGPSGDIEKLTIVGNWWNGSGHEVTPVGTLYPREVIRVMPMFVSSIPVFFNDTFSDDRVDATTMELVKKLNLRSVAVLPLHSANKQIGALILEGEVPHSFTQQETRLFSSLAPQIATVVENRRQFEQAQKQAERESRLNVISQKIQSATTVEAVLQIAARELGHTLGAPLTIAQLGLKETLNDN
jgi:GAF domain-containing protein/HAMP domain-containing protein